MEKSLVAAIAAIAISVSSAMAQNAMVETEGANVGVWTHDYEAAVSLAKEKGLPLFINFTGSDWCGWCKLMDKKVFSTDAWKDWARENIVLAYVNFPRNPDLVPRQFVRRNRELQSKFGIMGYPTYVVLADDGKTVLGQLGASRDATPEGFIADLEQVLAKAPPKKKEKSGAGKKKDSASDGEAKAEAPSDK